MKKEIILLFQKEILLEEILSLLHQDDLDVKSLLYHTFEKIQSNNYCPPTGKSLIQDGYFEFGDKINFPTPKWKHQKIKEKLQLNFEKINQQDIFGSN